jgi:hypothetical protein
MKKKKTNLKWLHLTYGYGDSYIAEQFIRYHEENPHVYHELKRLALQLKQKGHKHYGMKGLFEVMRWHMALYTTDTEFKLNNNYTAFYSRMIMENEPQLEGFFRVRESVAD